MLATIIKKLLARVLVVFILITLSVICSSYLLSHIVYAEDDDNFEENSFVEDTAPIQEATSTSNFVDIQLFQESVELNLPRNKESYWFNIPTGTIIGQDNYLDLNMTVSNTLINERSSITLAVNGTTLDTKWIHEITDNDQSHWRVSVPPTLLKTGEMNELSITTAQRSIEGDCADIDNPSNWVRFDSNSFLHMSIVQFGTPSLGNMYSFFYNNFDDRFSIQNEYILPQNPDKTVLQGMLKIASSIGAYSNKNLIKNCVSYREPSNPSIKNKLFIGTIDNWLNSSTLLLPDMLNKEEGFLSVVNNNALISGKDEIGLKKAIDFFASNSYLDQINENQLKVVSNINESDEAGFTSNETGYYNFSDFGYKDIDLAGAFHQKTTFRFKQPGGIKSGDDSYINIKFHHSKALLSDNSLITVYFNDVAAGSEKLSNSNADGGNLKVKIPEEIRDNEVIEVRVEVYNYLGKVDCSKDFSDTAWIVIENQSEIYFEPSDTGIYPALTSFPYISVSKENNNITMGMPTDYDMETLNIMTVLSTKIGQVSGNPFNFTVCTESDGLTEQEEKNNMIFFGSFDDIWIPDEVKSRLGIQPVADGVYIKENLQVTNEMVTGKIIFQVIRSPWDFNKKVYIVMYDPIVKAYAEEFLSDTNKLNLLSDQISIVDKSGQATNYAFGDNLTNKDNKVPLTWERVKYSIEKNVGLPIWLLIFATVLIIINIFVLFRVLKKKGRFEKAAKDMGNSSEEIEKLSIENEKTTSSFDEERNDNTP
jgi:hypothetical protein